ncbi:MAG TPA: class I SAM-dependent methyltransferase [Terriglobia bacterium]|nr:class I SAM-dependent methyltransferase [Terriglobia bacterium]
MSPAPATKLGAASPPAPFDALAATYDEQFTDSLIGSAQRKAVWQELDRLFLPGQRILEINCGTGVDALHLARRGVEVVACDSSSRMIEVARERLRRAASASESGGALGAKVKFEILPTEEIGKLHDSETPFDGVLSNFAGLNCVEDLRAVSHDLAQLLKPGAVAALCLFGPCCAWEILWYLARGNARKAFRRRHSFGELAELGQGTAVRVRYPTVRTFERLFAPEFRLTTWKGIGVAVPPSYVEPLARRFPRFLGLAVSAERGLSSVPLLRGLGDHVFLVFERV